jgi:rod shape-determining protein MreD
MRQLKIAVVLLIAIALPSALRAVWQPMAYVDLALVVVVYFALQREPMNALFIAAIAGIATDALSRGLLGAGGFSKVLTAYAVYFVASRVMLDTTILRIPVLAAAAVIDNLVYVGMNRLLGLASSMPFVQALSIKVVATTIVGTILLFINDNYLSEKARQHRQFTFRRKVARRPSATFGRKRKRSTSRQW